MTNTLRRAGSAAVAAILIPLAIVAGGGAAHAAGTTPPYEPNTTYEAGMLTFYNSAGDVITSGSTADQPFAAYVEGSAAIRSGDTKATLFGYLPVEKEDAGNWQGEALGSTTAYPNSAAPGALATATDPVETGGPTDYSIADLEQAFPNTATDDYAGLYQLRLETSAPGLQPTTTYDVADLEVSGTTWNEVYPSTGTAPTGTTTTLKESPSGTVKYGSKVTYTATVTPSTATGSVKFTSGGSTLRTVTVSGGKATYSTTYTSDGSHSVTATFVPGTSDYTGSSSSAAKVTVSATKTSTKLTLSTKKVEKGHKVKLTAKESPSVAGKITFKDGSKTLKTVTVKNGSATYSTTKLAVGTQKITAKFVPSNTKADSSSTSAVVKVKVTK